VRWQEWNRGNGMTVARGVGWDSWRDRE
jgi:hypothetical protein